MRPERLSVNEGGRRNRGDGDEFNSARGEKMTIEDKIRYKLAERERIIGQRFLYRHRARLEKLR